jgi:hypothetical protein
VPGADAGIRDVLCAGADSGGSFSVPGGAVKTVTLHLPAKGKELLARSHVLRIRATIVAHDPAGATHTTQTTLTLRAPKAKHGKR